MKKLLITYLALISLGIGCSQNSNTQRLDTLTTSDLNFEKWSYIGKMAYTSPDSLIKITSLDYLKYLGTFKYNLNDTLISSLENNVGKLPPTILWKYTINYKWITKTDVDSLIKYVYSKQPAHIPWPMISSMIPYENTTVGIEAMHLINIYRYKEFYYPSLCSSYYFCKPENQDKLADEFINWWNKKDK